MESYKNIGFARAKVNAEECRFAQSKGENRGVFVSHRGKEKAEECRFAQRKEGNIGELFSHRGKEKTEKDCFRTEVRRKQRRIGFVLK